MMNNQLVGEIGMVLRIVRKIHPIPSIPATHFNLCDTFCPGGCDLRTLLLLRVPTISITTKTVQYHSALVHYSIVLPVCI